MLAANNFIAESLMMYLHHHTVMFKLRQCPFDHPALLTNRRLRALIIISFQDDDRSEHTCQHQPFQLTGRLFLSLPMKCPEHFRCMMPGAFLHHGQAVRNNKQESLTRPSTPLRRAKAVGSSMPVGVSSIQEQLIRSGTAPPVPQHPEV